jgi:hypothetical protein
MFDFNKSYILLCAMHVAERQEMQGLSQMAHAVWPILEAGNRFQFNINMITTVVICAFFSDEAPLKSHQKFPQ